MFNHEYVKIRGWVDVAKSEVPRKFFAVCRRWGCGLCLLIYWGKLVIFDHVFVQAVFPSVRALHGRNSPNHCSRIFPVLRSALNQSSRNKKTRIARTHCLNLQVHVGVLRSGANTISPPVNQCSQQACVLEFRTWFCSKPMKIGCTFFLSLFLFTVYLFKSTLKCIRVIFTFVRDGTKATMRCYSGSVQVAHIHVPTFARQFSLVQHMQIFWLRLNQRFLNCFCLRQGLFLPAHVTNNPNESWNVLCMSFFCAVCLIINHYYWQFDCERLASNCFLQEIYTKYYGWGRIWLRLNQKCLIITAKFSSCLEFFQFHMNSNIYDDDCTIMFLTLYTV